MTTVQDTHNPTPRATAGNGAPSAAPGTPNVRVFTIPGSHPGVAVQRMLDHKGIPYKRTDLLPVASWGVLRALRFPRVTVPAIKINGLRTQGSIGITRELERLAPRPPLFPADPDRRAMVEQAEQFGDEDLQGCVRQILLWALQQSAAPLRSFMEGAKVGLPHGLGVRMAGPFIAMDARAHNVSDAKVREGLTILPGMLQRIDDWIADGVLDGKHLNAADFQIAASLRLAMTFDDLRPALEHRPAGRLARRVVPDYPGEIPPVLPAAWLQPLRASAA